MKTTCPKNCPFCKFLKLPPALYSSIKFRVTELMCLGFFATAQSNFILYFSVRKTYTSHVLTLEPSRYLFCHWGGVA